MKKKQNKAGLMTLSEAHKEIGMFSLYWLRWQYLSFNETQLDKTKDPPDEKKLNAVRFGLRGWIWVKRSEVVRFKGWLEGNV